MLRIPSPLPDEIETLVHQTIGCCIAVHRGLGPGLLESTCFRAVCIELHAAGVPFKAEKHIPVTYRGQLLCHHRLDLVVANSVVVEIKSVERPAPIHHAQLLNYLRVSGLRVGLLVNFNLPTRQEGIKRIVL
jgi:GxxExxY protein